MKHVLNMPGFFMFDSLMGIALLVIMSTILAQSWGLIVRSHHQTVYDTHALTALISAIETGSRLSSDAVHTQKIVVNAHEHGLPTLNTPFKLIIFDCDRYCLVALPEVNSH